MADLLRYPGLARAVLPSSAFASGAATRRGGSAADRGDHADPDATARSTQRDARAAAVSAAGPRSRTWPGVTLTGLPVLGHDAEQHVRTEIPRVFAVSLGLVLLYTLVHFRSVRDALLSLSMVAFSLIVLLAFTRVAGVRLNMINLAALPLLIGMTLDYGIFLVSLARDARRHGRSRDALLDHVSTSARPCSSAPRRRCSASARSRSTACPAVQSLGVVVAVGMIASLGGTLFLLAPLLCSAGGSRPSPRARAEQQDGQDREALPVETSFR